MTISAVVIQDSITPSGKRITTFELEYPRFIHSEFMTHRLFSRNSASSRAIPIKTMNDNILNNPAQPIHWGKNQSGMQAKEELDFATKVLAQHEWGLAMRDAVRHSQQLDFFKAHKQLSNRLTEPFQHMKVVLTATEFANWVWLRDHPDAQPEIRELAKEMGVSYDHSTPVQLQPGEWHLPYVNHVRDDNGVMKYYVSSAEEITWLSIDEAKMISASCCAQVSYRKFDDTLEKAKTVFDRLINSEPVHASPVEHQATPIATTQPPSIFNHTVINEINMPNNPGSWQEGITHADRNGKLWSGNFQGWIQFRQLIPNHSKWEI